MNSKKQIAFAIGASLLVIFLTVWVVVVALALMRGRTSLCPSCRSHRTRPAWPRMSDRLLPSFVITQRCEVCRKRFYSGKPVDYTKRPK